MTLPWLGLEMGGRRGGCADIWGRLLQALILVDFRADSEREGVLSRVNLFCGAATPTPLVIPGRGQHSL